MSGFGGVDGPSDQPAGAGIAVTARAPRPPAPGHRPARSAPDSNRCRFAAASSSVRPSSTRPPHDGVNRPGSRPSRLDQRRDLRRLAGERRRWTPPAVPPVGALGRDEADVARPAADPDRVAAVRRVRVVRRRRHHPVRLGAERQPERLHLGPALLVARAERRRAAAARRCAARVSSAAASVAGGSQRGAARRADRA